METTSTVGIMTSKKSKTHGPTATRVATNVARLRKAQGLTRKELADRTNGLISVEMLRGIENGESPEAGRTTRRVDVDDLVVLAQALNSSPSALLLGTPDHKNASVEITGAGEFMADEAWRWARGDFPLPARGEERTPGAAHQRYTLFAAYGRPWWQVAPRQQDEFRRVLHEDMRKKGWPVGDWDGLELEEDEMNPEQSTEQDGGT